MKKFLLISLACLSLTAMGACNNSCPNADNAQPAAECPPCPECPSSGVCGVDLPKTDDTLIQAGAEEIALPKPALPDVSLEEALKNRRSVREYTDQGLKLQDVSNLLWAANGINREDGKRTAPSARNMQSVTIYALFEQGAYKYDHTAHKLIRLTDADMRPLKQAPMELVFTSSFGDPTDDPAKALDLAHIRGVDAGTVAQNTALYCSAAGLATVIRMIRERNDDFVKALSITDKEYILFNMAIGYEKK